MTTVLMKECGFPEEADLKNQPCFAIARIAVQRLRLLLLTDESGILEPEVRVKISHERTQNP